MKEEIRQKREAQILMAAFDVLDTKGFAGVSMLAVSKAAKASNETLYQLYGNKQGLLLALVADHMAAAGERLDAVGRGDDMVQSLRAFGRALLDVLVAPRMVALHRAAAADASGTVGRALGDAMRDVIRPKIAGLMQGAQAPDTLAELYLTFLVGDLQIRRVTGALPAMSDVAVQERADAALEMFLMLTGWTAAEPARGPAPDGQTPERSRSRGRPFWLGWVRH